jgi:hypothetical protein
MEEIMAEMDSMKNAYFFERNQLVPHLEDTPENEKDGQ